MPFQSVPSRRQTDSALRWTLSYIRPYRRTVGLLAGLSLAEIALRALTPWPLKAIVDSLTQAVQPTVAGTSRSTAYLLLLVIAGFVLQVAHQLVLLSHTRVQSRIGQSMVFDLRARLFAHLQNLALAHHATGWPADAVYRIDTDAMCLDALILRGLLPLAFSVITLLVMFGVLVRLDAALAVASMAVVPFMYVSLRRSIVRTHSRAEQAKALESAVVTQLYESLSAIRLVKMFAREEHESDRFGGAARAAIRERTAVIQQESLFGFWIGAIAAAGASVVLALGTMHVLDGRLTVGALLLSLSYLGFVYGPLSAIATTTGSLHNAVASARRIRDVLRLPRESDAGAVQSRDRLIGNVSFENVSFAYRDGDHVLRDVSFAARTGETIALVGPSGAGKTTLVSLLARLYDATSGRILVDGIDVRSLPLKWVRQQIAVVPQDSILLAGTIAGNILYGRLDASDADVVAAAAAAECLSFIERLPQRFDTPLGDAGAGMSGGQRQRLSIARAFLKDAPILILDEPTASLDAVSERAVLAALARLRRGRTTLVIAHRLSTVRAADRIVVLEGGTVVAQGRHSELLEKSELYRRLAGEFSAEEDREVDHDVERLN